MKPQIAQISANRKTVALNTANACEIKYRI